MRCHAQKIIFTTTQDHALYMVDESKCSALRKNITSTPTQDHALYPVDESTCGALCSATNRSKHHCGLEFEAVGTCAAGTEAERGQHWLIPRVYYSFITMPGLTCGRWPGISIRQLRCETLCHPSYFQALLPKDYYLFHFLSNRLCGKSLVNETDLRQVLTDSLPRGHLIFTAGALRSSRQVGKTF